MKSVYKKIILAFLIAATFLCFASGCAKKEEEDTDGEFNYSDYLTEDGYFKGITASDYVTLPDYTGLEIPESVTTVTDEHLKEQLNVLLEDYCTYETITNRALENGDTVNIDYVGSIDGVNFEGGNTNGAGTTVTIGVTSYIDDFLEQLIGHYPGETFDIEVTFPDPYTNNPDLAGKDAVFTVTINFIVGEAIYPELTDTIAAEFGYDTAEELTDVLKQTLVANQKLDYVDELLSEAEISEYPQELLDFLFEADKSQISYLASLYSLDLDTFISYYTGGLYAAWDEYVEGSLDTYKGTLKYFLAVQAIAEAENITVPDILITEGNYEDQAETYGSAYVKWVLLTNQVVPDFIFESAAN